MLIAAPWCQCRSCYFADTHTFGRRLFAHKINLPRRWRDRYKLLLLHSFTLRLPLAQTQQKKKKKKTRLTITRLVTPPVLRWTLANINKALLMYHRQTGSDRFCYEFSLLHIPPWFRGFTQPALQNCRALSAYWCPAHSEDQRPPTSVLTGPSVTQQTEMLQGNILHINIPLKSKLTHQRHNICNTQTETEARIQARIKSRVTKSELILPPPFKTNTRHMGCEFESAHSASGHRSMEKETNQSWWCKDD